MSIHKDHRQRVRTKFEEQGLDMFEEHQALELLLFYAIPRKDTNVVAHNLINRFKSFGQVLDAPIAELEKVDGVGHSTAVYLRLLREAQRYYGIHQECDEAILNDINDCGQYLIKYFDDVKVETVYMLGLDAKKKVLCCREVAKGSVNSAAVSVRKIVEIALSENLTSVILAHNHPSGLALPSAEDLYTTKRVAHALAGVDVKLVDHIIVYNKDFVSMVQSGIFNADLY